MWRFSCVVFRVYNAAVLLCCLQGVQRSVAVLLGCLYGVQCGGFSGLSLGYILWKFFGVVFRVYNVAVLLGCL